MSNSKLYDGRFRYKGWFFACPVYMNFEEDQFGEFGAEVEARHEWLEWWFSVNEFFVGISIWLMSLLNPEYEPAFPFRVTGEANAETKAE